MDEMDDRVASGLRDHLVGFRWAGWLLTTFFVLNCLVLIIVVLLQSGKAADLAGAFGGAGSQTAFGPRGAASVLSQATTWCAVMFMVCALAMVVRVDRGMESSEGGDSILQQFSKPTTKTAPAHRQRMPGSSHATASGAAVVYAATIGTGKAKLQASRRLV